MAETEFKELLDIEERLDADPFSEYQTLTGLAGVLGAEHKFQESESYLRRCIKIANLPNSPVKSELRDLYKRLDALQTERAKVGSKSLGK